MARSINEQPRLASLNDLAQSFRNGIELRVPEKAPDVIRRFRIFHCEVDDAVTRMAKLGRPEIPIMCKESGLSQAVKDWHQIRIGCAPRRAMIRDGAHRYAPAPELLRRRYGDVFV